MSKVTLNDVENLENETTAVGTINTNSAIIEAAFDNTLSRDGSAPSQMLADLDMNSNRIINLPAPVSDHEPLRKVDYAPGESAEAAAASALAAAASAASVVGDAAQTAADRIACADSAQSAADSAALAASYTGEGAVQYDVVQSLDNTQKAQAQSNIGLGTAATKDTGTSAGNVVILDGSAKLPAVDGSQLTNLPASTSFTFQTRAALAATNLDSSVTAVTVMRYSTSTNVAPAIYTRLSSTPPVVQPWHLQDAGSHYWQLTMSVISPDMLGAAGDNSTDDRNPVQYCFDYNAAFPCEILFQRFYKISGPVGHGAGVDPNGVVVRGTGVGTSGLTYYSSVALYFPTGGPSTSYRHAYVRLSDFTLNASNTGAKGIYISNALTCVIERLHVYGFTQHGIHLNNENPSYGSLQVVIRDCKLSPSAVNANIVAGTNCIRLDAGNYVTIERNYISGYVDATHRLTTAVYSSGDSTVFFSNIFESCAYPIDFEGSYNRSVCDHPVGSTITGRHFVVGGNYDALIFHPRGTTLADIDYSSITPGHGNVNIYLNQHGYYSNL